MPLAGRPKFTRCDLHVGSEKTGSTSLQRFFGLNRTRLLHKGVFVPQSLSPNAASGDLNHIFLTTVSFAGDGSKPNDLQRGIGLLSLDRIEAHRQQIADALAQEIAALPSHVDRIVLSNEHIHSRLHGIADLSNLKNFLIQFCDEIRIIVYLRPQHEVALSAATTALRVGAPELRLIPDFNTENGFDEICGVNFDYFNYDKFLTNLETVFGEKAICPRIYDDGLINRNVIDDFFSAIDIDIRGMSYPRRENTNLSRQNIGFLLALNRFIGRHPSHEAIRDAAIDYFAGLSPGQGLRPGRQAVERFSNLFELSNEDVRARWFPARHKLFSLKLAEFPENSESVVLTTDDYFEVFCEIVEHIADSNTNAFLLSKLVRKV